MNTWFRSYSFPLTPIKIIVVAYFSLPFLFVDADIIVGDPSVDFIEEVDGVVHRPVEDVAAAIELLGHDPQVLCQRFPFIAEEGLFFSLSNFVLVHMTCTLCTGISLSNRFCKDFSFSLSHLGSSTCSTAVEPPKNI